MASKKKTAIIGTMGRHLLSTQPANPNRPAVKSVQPQEGHNEKKCEIQGARNGCDGGGLMAKNLNKIQVNLCCLLHRIWHQIFLNCY